MSLKDLFKNRESFKVSPLKSTDDVAREAGGESHQFIEEFHKDADRFIPFVDYNDPANFARYGLAEKYYADAIKRIHQTYPYDGSLREKTEWHNSSSFIDKHIFDYEYPRTNGYVIFSADGWGTLQGSLLGGYGAPASSDYEYIQILGGPGTGSSMANLKTGFTGSNVYDADSNRQSNLEFNLVNGVTVEFWLKKDSFINASTEKEVVFDLWNGHNSSSADYGRLRIELTGASSGSPFLITVMSGTSGFQTSSIGADLSTTSLASWGHYAFSFISGSSDISASLYVNGELNELSQLGDTSINEVTGTLNAYIGALRTAPSGNNGELKSLSTGAGKLSASLDEFRYWKHKRTSEDIGRYWFTQVHGGTNTDTDKYNDRNPVDLGVYFKFNEGITGVASTDSTVLDYSGRYTNGTWTGYTSNSRNAASAIVSASAAKTEFKDPIIYSSHPDVVSYSSEKKLSGSAHDVQNNSALYNMIPRWVIDEDLSNGGQIKNLTQILASYFDTLHLQIEALPTLREATYSTYTSASVSSSVKPLPFANRLLESVGLEAPELFIDAEIIEKLTSRDERRDFEEELHDIKNLIYHNIYNNLAYVYKSKGTEKSFRNLVRCFGIDDELIKLNVYGQDAVFRFKDNFKSSVIKKKSVDFNHDSRFGATVYQYPQNSELGYVTGSAVLKELPCTFETQVIFPKKKKPDDTGYFGTRFLSSSLFGAHSASTADSTDLTWPTGDASNFQVYAVRSGSSMGNIYDERDAFFVLTSSNPYPLPQLTSSIYSDVYNDTKWNFAVRIKHDKHDHNNLVPGVTGSERTYTVEFHGVNTFLDEALYEFTVSSSIDATAAEDFIKANKRLYVGAHRTNFTGALLQSADARITSLRYWCDYLDNDTIKAHAKDPMNFGLTHPYRNLSVSHSGSNYEYTPSIEALALNWDFETVTGSGAGGTSATGDFTVLDFSSGSSNSTDRYGELGAITKRKYPGRGDFFVSNSTSSVNDDYLYVAKQYMPETIVSHDMISIVDQDDATFTRESRPTQVFFAAEKSMYQTISEEMVNMFATIVDFNNLVGEPVNRYRPEYKDLTKLRQLFFERVKNTPDLDKYVDFYKWIDNSISTILQQMMPASANVSENLRTMVESHLLERNKIFNKYPTLRSKKSLDGDRLDAGSSTPGNQRPYSRKTRMLPSFKYSSFGYKAPPISGLENENSYWWLTRTERNHPTLTSGDADVNSARDSILSASSPEIDSFKKRGRTLAARFEGDFPIHGGVNFRKNKIIRYAHLATTEFGPTTIFTVGSYTVTASNNFVLFTNSGIEEFSDSTDQVIPSELDKKKWNFIAANNSENTVIDEYDYNILKGDLAVPFNLYKHSNVMSGGYHDNISNNFKSNVDFTNLHVDTYGPDNETPMQGPFTEKHVGGMQHRHIGINRHDTSKGTTSNLDEQSTRPEDWFILMGSTLGSSENAVGIVGPTYTSTGEYDKDTPRARFYRGLTAKRPVNIRNIYTSGSTLGNYSSSIEYVSSVGRTENNAYFKENEGVSLPSKYVNILPKTTNLHSLMGIAVSEEGNIFGPSPSNLNNTSNRIASDTQLSLPRRDLTGSDSIIVSRFSAPGGPEISSRGYLDIIAEERSVYNALPFRNLSVRSSGSGESGTIRSNILPGTDRSGLRTLLTRHCGQFGIENQFGSIREADYDTVGSYHKINRNTLKRIEFSGDQTGDAGTAATASVYNNYWLSSQIPRSDLQYGWLTASFESYPALAETYGFAARNGLVSSSIDGVTPTYNFVSASQVSNSDGTVVPFSAHNTYLVDGVNSGENLLSASNFPTGYISGLGGVTVTPEAIHGLSLLRNGSYQWPTWKQIRTGENQVARYQRRNNILSITTDADKVFTIEEGNAVVPERMGGILRQFTEPAIMSKYKPIVNILEIDNLPQPLSSEVSNVSDSIPSMVKFTHGNDKDMFCDDEINFILDLESNTSRATNTIKKLYIDSLGESSTKKFRLFSYRETIYPLPENSFLSGSRSRLTFDYPEWKSGRSDRKKASTTNSMKLLVASQSMWPMDARDGFATSTLVAPGSGSGAGELQNGYTIFHDGKNLGSSTSSTKSVKFNKKAYLTASIAHSIGPIGFNYLSSSMVSLWFKAEASRATSGQNASASLVSRGLRDYGLNDNESMAFDIMLNGHEGIDANVGSMRNKESDEISYDAVSYSDDSWHHVALAWYYKSATEHSMSLYIDGERQASGSTGSGSAPLSGYGSPILVGANPPNNDTQYDSQWALQRFIGLTDELTFFTGSVYDTGSGAQWNDSLVTDLYNEGNPTDVINTSFSSSAGPLTVVSHYRMGEHANDGPLTSAGDGSDGDSGFIQDATALGVTNMTGNLSASVTNFNTPGFSADGYGIVTDAPYNPGAGGNTNIFGPLYARRVPEKTGEGSELGYYAGDTLWEAATQAGKEPFYNSYDDFREEFRAFAKDYTIIPEFRISEHMEHYVETNAGNFLADNKNFLQLTGAATSKTSSAQEGFYKTYTNTDFMNYFDILRQEHSSVGYEPTNFVLKCNAVMKFVPYEGFYPASRTLQIATLFSKSYAENLNFKDPSSTSTAASYGTQVNFRTFLTPLFAPGVLYNSIKSGLAVDHPIMTGSFSVTGSDILNEATASHRISSSFGYRVPFEALVQPENYLGGTTIVDYEPHPSASINSTASWNGGGGPLYKIAMNNFVAEVPKFFLRNKGVTSIVSAKDNNQRYFKAEEGKEYRMRVVLRNGRVAKRYQLDSDVPRDNSGGQDVTTTGSFFTSPSITMYNRRSAFGPPVSAEFIKFNESFEPFTPPYMDGYADVEYNFVPDTTRYYFIDEVVSQLTASYYRVGEQYFTNNNGSTSTAHLNQMQVSASLNLLDIAKTKAAVFDPSTGEVISVEDDSGAPSVAIIQPKWEAPILDFSSVSATLPVSGSGSISKGMWHQYGSEPSINNGIFLEIQDLADEELTKPDLTGSLADLMGFPKSPIKLGQLLEENIVREAVVAVPFVQSGNKKRFFNIARGKIKDSLNLMRDPSLIATISDPPGDSIVDMVRKVKQYIFPPRFDFLTNKTVNPIAMYIFEFEHKFVKQDLIDIWQNLPPSIGRRFEAKTAFVHHELLERELMKGKVESNLQWMVFKVKQKAADNYFEMLTDSAQEPGFNFELTKGIVKNKNEFNYSYNWPYDFFSLVELVKMDAEIVIENKSDEE